MLEHLFARCPVLPVDAAVSVAKYSQIIGSTLADAAAFERAGDPDSLERAALLHIRILQLVCKTVPSHPEYSIAENASILCSLARRADACLGRLEAYAAALARASGGPPLPPVNALRPPEEVIGSAASRLRHQFRRVHVSAAPISVLERGAESIGAIAGRVVASAAEGGGDEVGASLSVTALVIPSQVPAADGVSEAELLYGGDVLSLLRAKELLHLGWLRVLRSSAAAVGGALGRRVARLQAQCQLAVPEAVTGAVVVRADKADPLRVAWFSSDGGADAGREASEPGASTSPAPDAVDDGDPAGPGSAAVEGADGALTPNGMVRAAHVVVHDDGPPFKFYDLRPMAAVHEAKAKARAGEAVAGSAADVPDTVA
jgi:hypothetical protein